MLAVGALLLPVTDSFGLFGADSRRISKICSAYADGGAPAQQRGDVTSPRTTRCLPCGHAPHECWAWCSHHLFVLAPSPLMLSFHPFLASCSDKLNSGGRLPDSGNGGAQFSHRPFFPFVRPLAVTSARFSATRVCQPTGQFPKKPPN
jgi:hypothetical protein